MPNIAFEDLFIDGQTLTHTHLEDLKSSITDQVNGNLDNSNIRNDADIDPIKVSALGGATPSVGEHGASRDGDIGNAGTVATTLEQEIQNLRQAIKEIRGTTTWYDYSLATTLMPQAADATGRFRGYIDGCIMTVHPADSGEHDITIGPGSVQSTNLHGTWMNWPSGMLKKLDAAWGLGPNVGGIAGAASMTADTWYHAFIIGKADGTADAGFDTSITASNLLSDAGVDFVSYRRIGSVLSDDSSNITGFKQFGDRFTFDAPPVEEIDNLTTASQSEPDDTPLPPDVRSLGHYLISAPTKFDAIDARTPIYIREVDHDDEVPDDDGKAIIHTGGNALDETVAQFSMLTDTDGKIHMRAEAEINRVYLTTTGWTDFRGRDA